jgi:hypothetical protein
MKPLEMATLFWQFCRLRGRTSTQVRGPARVCRVQLVPAIAGEPSVFSATSVTAWHCSGLVHATLVAAVPGIGAFQASEVVLHNYIVESDEPFASTATRTNGRKSSTSSRAKTPCSSSRRTMQRSGQSPRAPPLPRCRSRSASRRCSLDSRTALSPSGRRRCIHRDATRGGLPQRIEDIGVAAAKQREG